MKEFIEEQLVEQKMEPQKLAELIATASDFSEEDVMKFIKHEFSITNGPGRRSFKYCLRCNPHLNGSYGEEGTEAVAKHKIPNEKGVEQGFTGWEGLCLDCARELESNPYVTLEPVSGHEDLDIFTDEEEEVVHECHDPSWFKLSMVTEDEGFDWVECEECGIQGKRHGFNNVEVVGFDAR